MNKQVERYSGLCGVQSPLVGASVEVINGGHGIKNPLLQNNVLTQLVNAQQLGKYCLLFIVVSHVACHLLRNR